MEQENKELEALQLKSQQALTEINQKTDLRKMADVRYQNNQETYFVSSFDIPDNREDHSLQQSRPNVSREPVYVHNSGFFDISTSLDNFDHKFHRFTKITKPRQTLNYFIGEFERLKVTDDCTKYNIIFGKWVPNEVSQHYRLGSPENRIFQSFKEFFETRGHLLTPLLSKPPTYSIATPFSDYVAEATEWARLMKTTVLSFSCIIMLLAL